MEYIVSIWPYRKHNELAILLLLLLLLSSSSLVQRSAIGRFEKTARIKRVYREGKTNVLAIRSWVFCDGSDCGVMKGCFVCWALFDVYRTWFIYLYEVLSSFAAHKIFYWNNGFICLGMCFVFNEVRNVCVRVHSWMKTIQYSWIHFKIIHSLW